MLFRSNDTATTEIYTTEHTLSLHDALPIFAAAVSLGVRALMVTQNKTLTERDLEVAVLDRGKERRKFRRIPPEALHQLLGDGN